MMGWIKVVKLHDKKYKHILLLIIIVWHVCYRFYTLEKNDKMQTFQTPAQIQDSPSGCYISFYHHLPIRASEVQI